MKVICAGFGKTGTKSMYAALRELDYKVYDFLDHFWYHGDDWKKILSSGPGGSIEDFKRMYEDVDAVTDAPALCFWEEIHEAFPDSLIILTTREEKEFYRSLKNHIAMLSENFLYNFMQCLTPTGWKYYKHYKRLGHFYLGLCMNHPFDHNYAKNEIIIRNMFRQHQTYCLQNAPKDKLLVFNVSEGWEPLCKFLGKDVPDQPFPHQNIAGNIVDKLMATHPSLLRIQKELLIIVAVLSALFLVLIYFIFV